MDGSGGHIVIVGVVAALCNLSSLQLFLFNQNSTVPV
jgi:hypothetical protein